MLALPAAPCISSCALAVRRRPRPASTCPARRAEHEVDRLAAHVGAQRRRRSTAVARLVSNGPAPAEREVGPAARLKSPGSRVEPGSRRRLPALRARGAEVGLRRRVARHLAGWWPARSPRSLSGSSGGSALGLRVVALAEVRVADLAVGVDQVLGRPVLVAPGIPGAVVVVLRDRVAQVVAGDRVLDVAGVLLEAELGRVDADDRQPAVAVALVPSLDVGQRAQAVDARVGPEVDQHDAAAQARKRERLRVQPVRHAGELGRGAELRQAVAGRAANFDSPRRSSSRLATALERSMSPVGFDERSPAGRRRSCSGTRRRGRWRRQRGDDHHDAHHALQPRPAEAVEARRPTRLSASSAAPTRGVGDRDRHRLAGCGADRDHRGEDRPGARRVDEAERGADRDAAEEAVAGGLRAERISGDSERLGAVGQRAARAAARRSRAARRPRASAASRRRARRRRRPRPVRRS